MKMENIVTQVSRCEYLTSMKYLLSAIYLMYLLTYLRKLNVSSFLSVFYVS